MRPHPSTAQPQTICMDMQFRTASASRRDLATPLLGSSFDGISVCIFAQEAGLVLLAAVLLALRTLADLWIIRNTTGIEALIIGGNSKVPFFRGVLFDIDR
jgi:hypothetical protein